MTDPADEERLALLIHDLQNALAIVRGQAQLAQRRLGRGEPDELRRLPWRLRIIDQAAIRMAQTLTTLPGPRRPAAGDGPAGIDCAGD